MAFFDTFTRRRANSARFPVRGISRGVADWQEVAREEKPIKKTQTHHSSRGVPIRNSTDRERMIKQAISEIHAIIRYLVLIIRPI